MVAATIETNGASAREPSSIELNLVITDRELIDELTQRALGDERDDFAINAMRIGALALRQAQGRIDAENVRREGDRFIENMSVALDAHQREVANQIADCLKGYFDPNGGQFSQRVKSLVERDGEIERVIRGQIAGGDSELARTLTNHVGADSPIMRTLDPGATDGLIVRLSKTTEETLAAQRERILSEFSLDNGDGALSRLVAELTKNHGEVGEALEKRIEAVTGEFSLDKEDSALSRLVGRVETAQKQISGEFSLDEENSALARMRKELLDVFESLAKKNLEVFESYAKKNSEFQIEVSERLAAMSARKEESERGTRHGGVFEEAVFGFVSERSQRAGDIATHTGNDTGSIRNNKKGDAVIVLGRDHFAAGARIVIEAKQDASYNLDKALTEIESARKNRDAGLGLFVFSKRAAPETLEPLNRYGNDIVVVWDAEDPASDAFFDAGLSIAKGIAVADKSHANKAGADVEAIRNAILEVERQAGGLVEIARLATTIYNNSNNILNRARIMGEGFERQIDILNAKVANIQ